jgi:hypothetical protein
MRVRLIVRDSENPSRYATKPKLWLRATMAMRERLLADAAYSYGYTVLFPREYGCGLMSKTLEKTVHDAPCGQVPIRLLLRLTVY